MDRQRHQRINNLLCTVVVFFRLLLAYLLSLTERRYWVHPINEKREERGAYDSLVEELRNYPVKYEEFLRMKPETFDFLLKLVRPKIQKMDTHMRRAIKPELRLALTLWFLATGLELRQCQKIWRIGASTASMIVRETCAALWETLAPVYMPLPQTADDWKTVSHGFKVEWNFPHCIGAVDGKHVFIKKPANAGSEFFSYKGAHSIILMAVVDAYYRFIYIDVGRQGSQHDGGVWEASALGKKFLDGQINLPQAEVLPGSDAVADYVLVGDDAFPLKKYLLKPYPGRELSTEHRIYNYRLSRARRVVENAFGILSQKWRVLLRPMQGNTDNIKMMVASMCVLHNFLISVSDKEYCPPGLADEISGTRHGTPGHWRMEGNLLPQAPSTRSHHAIHLAHQLRDIFSAYFNGVGAVNWQRYEVERR